MSFDLRPLGPDTSVGINRLPGEIQKQTQTVGEAVHTKAAKRQHLDRPGEEVGSNPFNDDSWTSRAPATRSLGDRIAGAFTPGEEPEMMRPNRADSTTPIPGGSAGTNVDVLQNEGAEGS